MIAQTKLGMFVRCLGPFGAPLQLPGVEKPSLLLLAILSKPVMVNVNVNVNANRLKSSPVRRRCCVTAVGSLVVVVEANNKQCFMTFIRLCGFFCSAVTMY
jgi:hypothetical protein